MTNPTYPAIPDRGEALRVGREILEAHSQWEKENNRLGAQYPWGEQHVILLGQAAMLAIPSPDKLKIALEALEPFAERALRYVPIPGVWTCTDDVEIWQLARNEGMEADITVGHLRRAAEALAALKGGK